MALRKYRFPLHVYLSALFVSLMVLFLAITIMIEDKGTREMMLTAAQEHFRLVEDQTRQGIQSRYDTTLTVADLLAASPLTEARTRPERLARLGVLAQPLRDRNVISATYVGYANGDFILIRRLVRGSELAKALAPPGGSVYLVQSVTSADAGKPEGRYAFYDGSLRLLEDRAMPDYVFDPRTRSWFRDAMASDIAAVSAPYGFFTTREAGITMARRSINGQAVAAVDVRLSSISDQLDRMRPTRSSLLAIFNDKGELVADADGNLPIPDKGAATLHLLAAADLDKPVLIRLFEKRPPVGSVKLRFDDQGETWQGLISSISLPGTMLYLAVAAPHSELLADAERIRLHALLVVMALLALAIVTTFLMSQLAARSLKALTHEAEQIRALKFDDTPPVHSMIAEIDTLGRTMASMKSTIRRFLEIGAGLAAERSFSHLLDRILTETIRIADARGGMIYLAENERTLSCELARWGQERVETPPPDPDPDADPDNPVLKAARGGSVSTTLSGPQFVQAFRGIANGQPTGVLAVPLRNRQGALLGVLVLLTDPAALDTEQHEIVALVEAVSGTAAAALDAQRLLLEQKRLLESFIELVADAIDRKSPYTGGHCRRVPELTEMMARAAERATEGPFADFALNEAQWEELHIAAWLHDCGKVTSPEYVIDKATKLETIYDRLHEVRMRFEVLKREAEAACWKAIAGGAHREDQLDWLRRHWAVLDDEFAFVASCNQGGEFMAPERIARLRQIAERQWTRTLDDRIGLSEEEKRRKAQSPPLPLPAEEPLLADRPEHVFPRRDTDRIPPDNPWGFQVEIPEHLYNRGELYNLCIGRGTLTAEDRFKINEHMIETIKMLSRLPFPPHLANVPEIAGGHHEKMDGTGYPRRLSREEMSVPARMMAIADIFEALTAVDRPYKQGKTVSESLAIMAHMRDDRHIDPELFELFVRGGVYREFSERFLRPEQIDEIDPSDYVPGTRERLALTA